MSWIRSLITVSTVVTGLAGWAMGSVDFFFYAMLISCTIIMLMVLVVETVKYYQLKPLRERYKNKPYQLQLLGTTVLRDNKSKLEPMDPSSPFWGRRK